MVIKSGFGKLDWKDMAKGLLMAVLGAVLTYFYGVLDTGEMSAIDWNEVIKVGLTSGIVYVLKNWLTNNEDKFLAKDRK